MAREKELQGDSECHDCEHLSHFPYVYNLGGQSVSDTSWAKSTIGEFERLNILTGARTILA